MQVVVSGRKASQRLELARAGIPRFRHRSPDFAKLLLLGFGTQGRMLTVVEAARRLWVSKVTVYKLGAEGRLAHVRIGNQIWFLPAAIGTGQRPG